MPDIQIYPDSPAQQKKISNSIVIVQRTAFEDIETAKEFVAMAKKNHNKVVVDIDDSFHLIDESHPEWDVYKHKIDALNYTIAHSDLITVTTNPLKDGYKDITKKVAVLPNPLDKKTWKKPLIRPRKKRGPIQLVYMGTPTHQGDFNMILPALDSIHKKNPGIFELNVIGVSKETPDRPWLKKLKQPTGKIVYPKFVKWFLKQGPFDIGLAPLEDTPFNSGKSDIKALDYLAAGILPVLSDVKAYQGEVKKYSVLCNNTRSDWERTLTKLMLEIKGGKSEISKKVKDGQKYLWNERDSKIYKEKLEKIIEKI